MCAMWSHTAWTWGTFSVLALAGCPAEDNPITMTAGESGTPSTDTAPDESSGSTPTSPTTESTGPGEASSSSSTSGDAPGACGQGRACLDEPPLGWTGPLVVAKSQVAEDLPGCDGAWPGNDITRFEGFSVPPAAECECLCELSAATCSMSFWRTDNNTGSCFFTNQVATEGCNAVEIVDGGILPQSFVNFGATCDQQANETIPEIPWEAVAKGCTGAPSDEVCDGSGRLCYDLPGNAFEQQVCFIAEGDVPCPPDTDYQQKTLRYTAVEDSRDCTSCQCGQLNSCITEYDIFATDDCSGAAIDTLSNSVCEIPVTLSSIMFDTSGLACPVLSESEPEGAATPLDPWTYCCSEPG